MGDQAEAPDGKSIGSDIAPVVDNAEETVVSETGPGRVLLISTRTTNYTDGVAIELAPGEPQVSTRELLMRNLTLGSRVVAALARVQDLGAVVHVVDVTTGHDDGLGSICASADAGLKWPVNPGCCELIAVSER